MNHYSGNPNGDLTVFHRMPFLMEPSLGLEVGGGGRGRWVGGEFLESPNTQEVQILHI